jgi:hypothetical protein
MAIIIFIAAAAEPEAPARATELLPQPTKAECHAQKRDVDGVESGGAAHAFAAAHATRQREAKQARQTEGQGAGLKNSGDDVKKTSINWPLATTTKVFFPTPPSPSGIPRRTTWFNPPSKEKFGIWLAEPIQNVTAMIMPPTKYGYFCTTIFGKPTPSYAFALRHHFAAHALKRVHAAV